jgi:CTP:molybdopterin cytidylyltransferase MocA
MMPGSVKSATPRFRAIVLAGERPGGGKLAREFRVPAGVMVEVAGKPSLERVMRAIENSGYADAGITCGPPEAAVAGDAALQELLTSPWRWLQPASGPAASALTAVEALDHFPTLLTAGDHALLTPGMVDTFCRQASLADDADTVVGLVPHARVQSAWPESRRTVLRFADGGYCGANLFAVLSPRGKLALAFWQQVENDRKRPWRIAWRLGIKALLRYLLRRSTLEEALDLLSERAGCRVRHVLLDDPRAAVDVDSLADQRLAERILSAN